MAVTLPKDTVYLIDGSGYIFRAYFAVRALKTSKGVPTNAVYGFTSMLLKLLKEHDPQYVAIAFDTGHKTFRSQIDPNYKAHRPKPPDDLISQIPWIHKVVDALCIPRLMHNGFEADDVIGTLSQKAKAQGHTVVIVTGDKDLMQLVDNQTYLLDELRAERTGTERLIGPNEVLEQMGVPPSHIVDVLALMGDASDNIPGVHGIGEKTAVSLVKEYGSLETILNAAPFMKGKIKTNLLTDQENALMSKRLVTLDTQMELGIELADLKRKPVNSNTLHALFQELEFKRLLADPVLAAHAPKSQTQQHPHSSINRSLYRAITDTASLNSLVSQLQEAKRIAIDTETSSIHPHQAHLVGISLAFLDNQAVYIPLAHNPDLVSNQLPLAMVKEALQPFLQDPNRTILAQNAKFDRKVLEKAGFLPFAIGGDPMLASYLLDADQAKHNLNDLSNRYLQHQPILYEEVCGTGKAQKSFSDVPLEQALPYAAEDADLAFRLCESLENLLEKEHLSELYHTLELPFAEVLVRMEQVGITIQQEQLALMSQEFATKLLALEEQAYSIAGKPFNLASPKQVADILFTELKLKHLKKTKTGFSTDAAVLEELAHSHALPKVLLEHRLLSKLKGTYVDALPKLIHANTGRVHTSFNQAITATGRLSSSDPNLQNIPARTKEGRRIREAFIAKEGHVLISLDYSQIELRILAHLANDPVMVEAFHKGEDIHLRTASEIFSVPIAEVSKEQRGFAKTINFGLVYGMGAQRLSKTLGIPRKEAALYIERYYERYAGIYHWQAQCLENAKKTQEVRTLFGRRRRIPEFASKNQMDIKRAERIAINTPIQGTAADIMKKAMIEADHFLKTQYEDHVRILLQVHDEMVLECPISQSEQVAKQVQTIMSQAYPLCVPVVVDVGIGPNWALAH